MKTNSEIYRDLTHNSTNVSSILIRFAILKIKTNVFRYSQKACINTV